MKACPAGLVCYGLLFPAAGGDGHLSSQNVFRLQSMVSVTTKGMIYFFLKKFFFYD